MSGFATLAKPGPFPVNEVAWKFLAADGVHRSLWRLETWVIDSMGGRFCGNASLNPRQDFVIRFA